ncbi:hypothetical protein ISS85_00085 [Candidatus Microgenomates bacterium]|nr:hypothetical protein [Candidatus Microgenomates bacterium]
MGKICHYVVCFVEFLNKLKKPIFKIIYRLLGRKYLSETGKTVQKQPFVSPVLKKIRGNPILKPIIDHFWESKLVFNPAAVYEGGKVHLVYRAVGDSDISVFGYASSKDGVHIDQRLKEPIYIPREPFETNSQAPRVCSPIYISGGGCGGCEDPKISKVEDRFYMTYVAWNGSNLPRVALTSISVNDFLNHQWDWERPVLISPPGVVAKSCVIFSEKINDQYAIFYRIFPNIVIDFVDDLNFDGKTKWLKRKFVIGTRKKMWDSRKVSAGAPPIKTKDGWLLIYHAVGDEDSSRYKIGAMLLDLKNPAQVLHRSKNPILEPTERYENEGHKSGIVYPSGAAVIKDRLLVYYGGADTVACAATANLSQFLDQLKYSEVAKLKPTMVS